MKPKILLTILIVSSIISPVKAWVEPTGTENIVAPLNSSSVEQTKEGRLGVKGGLVLSIDNATKGGLTNLTDGLLIYNTDSKQLEIYSGGIWQNVGGGGDSLPKGTIAFFNLSACPSGWTEKTELRGRYPVGLNDFGVLGRSVGIALNNEENRSVGQHSHGVTDPGHSHTSQKIVWAGGMVNLSCCGHYLNNGPDTTSVSATNISIQNSGSIAGTNAPYVQLLACEKQTEGFSSGGITPPTVGGESLWQKNGSSIFYNDGNVGVGTSTPMTKMEISGNTKVSGGNLELDQNKTIKVGNAYLSSGGDFAHLSNNEWYNGSSWVANAVGALIQIAGQEISFYRHDANGGHTRSAFFDSSGNLGLYGSLGVSGNLCIRGDCRSNWPVNSYWLYNVYSYGWWGGATAYSYDLVSYQPNGVTNYLNPFCYCSHPGAGNDNYYISRSVYGPSLSSCAATCMGY